MEGLNLSELRKLSCQVCFEPLISFDILFIATSLPDELLAPEPLKLKIAEKKTRNVPLWQNNRKEYNLYQVQLTYPS